jgi:hypothetical protein
MPNSERRSREKYDSASLVQPPSSLLNSTEWLTLKLPVSIKPTFTRVANMARAIRSSTLETRSARLKLPVSIKPIFVRVAKGLGLGYRMRVADGKRSGVRTIGAADDFAEADANDVLTFWQAQDKVRSLARADRGATAEPVTVAQALDAYEADLKTRDRDIKTCASTRRKSGVSTAQQAPT